MISSTFLSDLYVVHSTSKLCKINWQQNLAEREKAFMNKDEVLAKSRAENKNKDVYEQEVLKQVEVQS